MPSPSSPSTLIQDTITVNGLPSSLNGGLPPVPGQQARLRSDPTQEYVAGGQESGFVLIIAVIGCIQVVVGVCPNHRRYRMYSSRQ